jgi:hypothetical protein
MKKNEKQNPDEITIKASEFEKIMRHALGTPPPHRKPAKKSRAQKKRN